MTTFEHNKPTLIVQLRTFHIFGIHGKLQKMMKDVLI